MSQPALNPAGRGTSVREVPIRDYDLSATLGGGQAFRWHRVDEAWEGVVSGRWVRIEDGGRQWRIVTTHEGSDWGWLDHHLALDEDLAAVLATFPDDEPMRAAMAACRGLRLLRQDPWECLASFICSSSKQVVQIQGMVRLLAERFGEPVKVPPGHPPAWAFPAAERLASAGEGALRECKLGFRAPYLLGTARAVAAGAIDLAGLRTQSETAAREALLALPGVGRKVADCVLLFAYGFPGAFPVDVWIAKALQRFYFPRARRVTPARLQRFSATHFGSRSGYAQQYLFQYARTHLGRAWAAGGERRVDTAPATVQDRPVRPGARRQAS